MFYLIGKMFPWLVLSGLAGALMGWCWHCIKSFGILGRLEEERGAARDELAAAAAAAADDARRTRAPTDELDRIRAERDDYAARFAAVGHRDDGELDALRARAASLEGELAALRADHADLQQERSKLQGLTAIPVTAPAEKSDDEDPQYKLRYLASRVRYLESLNDEGKREVAQLNARLQGLASMPAPKPIEPLISDEEATRLKWQNRYLEERVATLEAMPRGRSDEDEAELTRLRAGLAEFERLRPEQEVEAGRARWRVRYLESRVKYLEERPNTELEGLRLRIAELEADQATGPQAWGALPDEAAVAAIGPDGRRKPKALEGPRNGQPDDLRMIAGVGPKLEETLHGLGVYHFDQIAAWGPAEIAWVDNYISFPGRIVREKWVAQCRELSQGIETEGARKYKSGEHQ